MAVFLNQTNCTFTDFRGKFILITHVDVFSDKVPPENPGLFTSRRKRYVVAVSFRTLPYALADGGVLLSGLNSDNKRLMALIPLKSTANVYNGVYNTQRFKGGFLYKSKIYHA